MKKIDELALKYIKAQANFNRMINLNKQLQLLIEEIVKINRELVKENIFLRNEYIFMIEQLGKMINKKM